MSGDMISIPVAAVDQQPFFEPWLGLEYKARKESIAAGTGSCCEGLWHIMGESHPGNAEDYLPGFTKGVVESLALDGYPFFDTLIDIATTKDVAARDRAALWSGFAFSNFVQEMLTDGRRRPVEQEWVNGARAFYGQLALTRPKQLLVVGKEQWNRLPSDSGIELPPIPMFDGDGTIDDLWLYAVDVEGSVHFTIATWIYHPSSRGLLDTQYARRKVRTVDMAICNIMSSVEQTDDGWFLDPWR